MPATCTKSKKEACKTQLSVDYPRQGETINCPQYTMRISAPEGVKRVDVAIDDGEWMACRQTNGHWWYDWSGYQNGEHEVVVRIETQEGKLISCEPHEFLVDLEPVKV
jgi:hypothetical protein